MVLCVGELTWRRGVSDWFVQSGQHVLYECRCAMFVQHGASAGLLPSVPPPQRYRLVQREGGGRERGKEGSVQVPLGIVTGRLSGGGGEFFAGLMAGWVRAEQN